MVTTRPIYLALFLLFAVIPAKAELLAPVQLKERLQAGGYSIYFRHAQTDWSQSDNVTAAGDWKNCDPGKMRQLSDEGRATASRIGEAIRSLGIPIGEILSSEYCRAVETVERLNVGPVKATTDVMNLRAAHFVGGNDAVVARLQAILRTPPAPGKNRIISGHGNLARAAIGAYPGEGGAIIIAAFENAPRGFRIVGELDPTDWNN